LNPRSREGLLFSRSTQCRPELFTRIHPPWSEHRHTVSEQRRTSLNETANETGQAVLLPAHPRADEAPLRAVCPCTPQLDSFRDCLRTSPARASALNIGWPVRHSPRSERSLRRYRLILKLRTRLMTQRQLPERLSTRDRRPGQRPPAREGSKGNETQVERA
jgi:hypothetical protein